MGILNFYNEADRQGDSMKIVVYFICVLLILNAGILNFVTAQDWNNASFDPDQPISTLRNATNNPITFGNQSPALGTDETANQVAAPGSPSSPTQTEAEKPKTDAEKKAEAEKAAKKKAEESICKTCCHGKLIDWSKYPATIHPMQRPGNFLIPYSSECPAYYSIFDQITDDCQKARPKSGYAPFAINPWPFFDADWRFVESIPCEDRDLVQRLKRIHLNDCWLFSTGGSYWVNYQHQQNSRLTETVNDFTLLNVRLYSDLWYRDNFRLYAEYIWADNFASELPPLPFDVDLGDLQNLFVDLKLFDYADKPVFVRGGRQELIYGSQRLVSPLPWANKRNTFDGVKLFRQGEKWDYDLFWAQFVPPLASDFDVPDENQNLAGSWLTYKPEKGQALDMYYLLYDNGNDVVQQGIVRSPFERSTVGSRWSGDKEGRLWDFEGAIQFGEQVNSDVFAGMATAGLGKNWKKACWNPTAWLYYDYASGDSDPNVGDVNTFNQVFPFGHYYLGWTDLVGRQNIHDLNVHMYLDPTPWFNVWLQYHHFWLDESADALYNAGGAAIRRDPTGLAGNNVGDEIDIVMNFHLTNYSDVLLSYATLFGGSFLENTAGPNQASDAESLYLIYQQRW